MKLKLLLSVIFLMTLLVGKESFGQNVSTIQGTVSDTKGERLPGVTVALKNTKRAVITDVNGRFTFKDVPRNSVLVFSYISFLTREVNIGERTSIDVKLDEQINKLEDIVVVGYGTAKRGDVTGAVGSVSMEDVKKAPVATIDQALAGRIAGVTVTSSEGQPGTNANITIRGIGSITGDASPLYVIDGFPSESSTFNSLNPNDIESIDVLKDASATAIYGSRGSNGVVMITTKRGKEGTPKITYENFFGVSDITKTMKVMSPYEFVRLAIEIDSVRSVPFYFNQSDPASPYYSASTTQTNGENLPSTLDAYHNVQAIDWQDVMFRSAKTVNHSLSVSGGSKGTKYLFSGNYLNQEGLMINTGFKRYQARLVLDQDINKKLKAGINANFSNANTYGALTSTSTRGDFNASLNLLYMMLTFRPFQNANENLIESFSDPNITASNDYRVNPYVEAINQVRKSHNNGAVSNMYVDWSFKKYFKFRSTLGLTYNTIESVAFNNKKTALGAPNTAAGVQNGVNGDFRNTSQFGWVNENTLNYNRKFKKLHNFSGLVGFTQQEYSQNQRGARATRLPNELIDLNGLDEGTPSNIYSSAGDWFLASFLGRINYDYNGKYSLTYNTRADGSSKFSEDNRWGYFNSFAVAWRISSEKFMKSLKFVDNAKLRLGYGTIGNNRGVSSDYPTYSSSNLGQSTTNAYPFNNILNPGYSQSTQANRNLRWESSIQTNLGLDLSLFRNRVSATIDVYDRVTDDLILNADIPSTTGFSNVFLNIGKIQNRGLEFSINTLNYRDKNFTWNSSFNISFNRDQVKALAENENNRTSTIAWNGITNPLYIAQVGQPVAQFYGLIYDGVYQVENFDYNAATNRYILKSDITTNGKSRPDVQPGDPKYRDINGDLNINAGDFTVIGRSSPIHLGGFTNNLTYKNFSLNVFFQWNYGNHIYNANRDVLEVGTTAGVGQLETFVNRWTLTNPSNEHHAVRRTVAQYSTRTLEDGSYLRLKTANLGYNLPVSLLKAVNVKSMRLYVSGQNIFTWSKYQGYDPEVSTKYTVLTPGFDYSAYPRARTLTFGANITL